MAMSKEEFMNRYMADLRKKEIEKERMIYDYKYRVLKKSKAKYHKTFYR